MVVHISELLEGKHTERCAQVQQIALKCFHHRCDAALAMEACKQCVEDRKKDDRKKEEEVALQDDENASWNSLPR